MADKYGVRRKKKGAPQELVDLQHLHWDEIMEMSNAEFLQFVRENYAEGGASIHAFAQCVGGCQAAILSGFAPLQDQCHHPKKTKSEVLKEALRTLDQQVAFVGITDRWHETATLFLSLFGPDVQITKESEINVRPSILEDHQLKHDVLETLKQSGYRDFVDEAVYSRAVEKFETLQKAVNLGH
eukprot:CAMPEP_0181329304 /NCGR_PEP_ID=MMETSP1101-20121128/23231_1 /TAXON_ID=46948 /ORGANISM="Rhodomonas abbreviata, Strain Caron Lab Isolate" /LENGTH=183 /DNA_ID=CAMNT_0023438357 /DNA_START=194 /DNA_END=745 /DNA_ORIENTATION=+